MADLILTRKRTSRKTSLVKSVALPPERLQPWFRSKKKAIEIRRTQTPLETKKWSLYFSEHGCIACGKRDRPHRALGFCQPCYNTIDFRLKGILKQVLDDASSNEQRRDDPCQYAKRSI